jgi:hypothetical protein
LLKETNNGESRTRQSIFYDEGIFRGAAFQRLRKKTGERREPKKKMVVAEEATVTPLARRWRRFLCRETIRPASTPRHHPEALPAFVITHRGDCTVGHSFSNARSFRHHSGKIAYTLVRPIQQARRRALPRRQPRRTATSRSVRCLASERAQYCRQMAISAD